MWSQERFANQDAESLIIRQYLATSKLPLRFYLEIGLLEKAIGYDGLLVNRYMRDVLQARGYDVTYSEYNGGHDYICWRGSLADGLIKLTQRE